MRSNKPSTPTDLDEQQLNLQTFSVSLRLMKQWADLVVPIIRYKINLTDLTWNETASSIQFGYEKNVLQRRKLDA